MTPGDLARPLRHVVLFRLHDGVDPAVAVEALGLLDGLADGFAVRDWQVGRSEDQRKGVVLVQTGVFETRSEFERFRASDRHAVVAARLAEVADWLVGDVSA